MTSDRRDWSHDEIAEMLGVYALDAVDGSERDVVEAHLLECPRCAAEVSEHRETAAMLAHTGAPAPEGIWNKIVAGLEEEPPELRLAIAPDLSPSPSPPELDELADRRSTRDRRRSGRWLPLGAAAAAVVLVCALVAGVVLTRSDDTPGTDIAVATLDDLARDALSDPASRRADLASDVGDVSVPVAIEPDGSGYLVGTSLPALDAAHTYQLWGVAADNVVSLGVLGSSPGVVAFHTDPSVETLVITLENAGGVPVSSNPPLLLGEVR